MASPSAELEQSLLSFEKLDRSSPDLWPEQIPGVSEFAVIPSTYSGDSPQPKWLQDLDQEDLNLLQEFGSLTASNLIEEVRRLQNLAYQLGLEEAKEMTRGKYLNILQKTEKKKSRSSWPSSREIYSSRKSDTSVTLLPFRFHLSGPSHAKNQVTPELKGSRPTMMQKKPLPN